MGKTQLKQAQIIITSLILSACGPSDNEVAIAQAKAAIEAARAAQTAGHATQLAVASQGITTILLVILVILLVVILTLGVYAFILQPRYARRQAAITGKWKAGPNARWGRVDRPQGLSLPAATQDELFRQMMVKQWMDEQVAKAYGIPPAYLTHPTNQPQPTAPEEDDWQWLTGHE